MTKPNKDEILWLASSLDPNGRLFSFNEGLYRSMVSFDLTYYQQLLKTISANGVLDRHMVRTSIAEEKVNALSVVLEHETIHPVAYPHEWSSLMFKDAALCHCDVHIELAKADYNLQDAHLWNVLFRHTTPVFIDYGSVIKGDSFGRRLGLLRQYTSYMIYPLYLMSKRQPAKARRYLTHSNPPLDLRDLVGYFRFLDVFNHVVKTTTTWMHSSKNLLKMLGGIRNHIKSLPLQGSSPWRGYHDDEFERNENDWHDKQRNVYKILSRLNPKTVLELGCATGWYAVIAAKLGSKVIALDVDDVIVNHIYKLAATADLPITPLIKDLFADDSINTKYRSEMVFALAIVHHLVLTQRYRFDEIAKTLSNYTERWLVTEFIDCRDTFVKNNLKRLGETPEENSSWYSLENFMASLSKHFVFTERFRSSSENRILLLAEKK